MGAEPAEEEKKKKWNGFSDRFLQRNLKNQEKQKTEDNEDAIDEILDREEKENIRIQKEIHTRKQAAKFLERQKQKIDEAQKKAKERIKAHKNQQMSERDRLIKRRDEARAMAMKVAEKIKERQEFEHGLDQQMEEDIDLCNLLNEDCDEHSNDEHKDTQSENLFDRQRQEENGAQPLVSHRSMDILDKLKKEKRRSLEVTGRILKVLSSQKNSMANGVNLHTDEFMDNVDMSLDDDEMCFLHPLSKKKKKKQQRNALMDAYGVSKKTKRKKKKASKATKNGGGNGLDSLLQINAIH